MNTKKSQTATEYLIILAVVIVIALIVVGVLGGIPSIGGGTSTSANKALLASQKVGILNYKVDTKGTLLKVQNNQADSVKITDIYVNDKKCSLERDYILRAGMKETITCYGVTSADDGNNFEYNIVVDYTDLTADASYSINDSNVKLAGVVAKGSELHSGLDMCYVGTTSTYVNCNSSHVGQDGYEDGTAKSFGSITDGTIKDLHTGLYWSNESSSNVADGAATTYCDSLNSNVQGGFSDWRVPNIVELVSVLGSKHSDLGKTSNPSPNGDFWFSGGSGDVWTSTEYLDGSNRSLGLTSDNSAPYTQSSFGWEEFPTPHAVCVRGETTGIKLVDTQKHFIDAKDGTILDLDTGVVWQKDIDGVSKTWDLALAYCTNLSLCMNGTFDNSGLCVGDGIKYDDWRLPTVTEGIALLDYSKSQDNLYPDAFGSQSASDFLTGMSYSAKPFKIAPSFFRGTVWLDCPGEFACGVARCVRDH